MSEIKTENLKSIAETMLITLYLRAMESQRPDALIIDEKSEALVKQIDYDFDRVGQVPMSEVNKVTIILRNRKFDSYVRDFLKRHPEAVVVHIGCGLDTRFERVVEHNSLVEWYDLDLPEVVAIRKKLIGDETEHYHLLGYSVLDYTWLNSVTSNRKRPFLFLAEGVSMYFKEEQVKSLVMTLRAHFPGAELVFDAFSPLHIWRSNLQISLSKVNKSFPRFYWGTWSGNDLEAWGEGIQLLDDWGYLDDPEPRLSYYRWMRYIPLAAKAGRIYHFKLGMAVE
jgi:O-methyltransferase involved in polyketide biosynthesis